jgi:hypothetical protein
MAKKARRRHARQLPPPSLTARTVAAIKRNPLKFWMTVGGALAVIVPAYKGLEWIDDHTDSIQLASHPFVYDHLGVIDKKAMTYAVENQKLLHDLQATSRQQQIDTANGKMESTVNDIKKWELELSKAKDQMTIDLITKQIEALKNTQARLTDQLTTLHKAKN